MFRLIKFILITLLLISAVLFFTPLNLYIQSFEKDMRPLILEEISGSIIKGSSAKVSYLGLNLGEARWLNYPSSWNSVTSSIELENKDYDLKAEVTKKPSFLQQEQ